jgi:hypothetical protein
MCIQEFVGYSCVAASGEIRHQHQTTKFVLVFTGEPMAVLKTLEIISESHRESFCICSSSRSVLICLNERSLTKEHSISILKIKEKLLALMKHKKDIKLVWIPAHMGIVLKEVADALAKDSIRKGEDVQYLILVTDLKSCWKTKPRAGAEEWYRKSGK